MVLFWNVMRNTCRECLREPIFYVLLASAVFLIGLFPSLAMFVFFEQVKLVVDSSMATAMVFGLGAAVLCASNTISKEIRQGTMLLIMSKPVPRGAFVSAKVAGVLAALTLFAVVCSLACLVSIRVAVDQFELDYPLLCAYYAAMAVSAVYAAARNYWRKTPFASEAVLAMLLLYALLCAQIQFLPRGAAEERLMLPVVPALVLVVFAIWVMGALTTALSTRLDTIPNFCVCFALFIAGLMSDYFLAVRAAGNLFAACLYAAIPNWQLFWLADAIANKQPIPPEYLGWAAAYTGCYMAACVGFAATLFAGKEIAGDSRV